MLELQRSLNLKTNGNNWTASITQEGREINWNRCIYMEAIEAIDSFNWKHWKDINAPDDWDNLWVELIDIWHFLMSEMMRLEYLETPTERPLKQDKKALIISLEQVTQSAVEASLAQNNNSKNLAKMLDHFFDCLGFSGLTIEDLYTRYVIKNQLNIFRQNHGYKDGTYQKMWQGKEDNVIAFGLMKNQQLSPEELYQALEKSYSLVD